MLIVAPDDTCGVSTLSRDPADLKRLYEKGYTDGKKSNRSCVSMIDMLACIAAMTRMMGAERMQNGTLMALGSRTGTAMSKYFI